MPDGRWVWVDGPPSAVSGVVSGGDSGTLGANVVGVFGALINAGTVLVALVFVAFGILGAFAWADNRRHSHSTVSGRQDAVSDGVWGADRARGRVPGERLGP